MKNLVRCPRARHVSTLAIAASILLALVGCSQPTGLSTPVDAATEYIRALGAGDLPALREVAHFAPDQKSVSEERQRVFGSSDEIEVADIEVFDEVVAESDGETFVSMFVTTKDEERHEVMASVRSTDAGMWVVFMVTEQ